MSSISGTKLKFFFAWSHESSFFFFSFGLSVLVSMSIPETTYNSEACDGFSSHIAPFMKEQSHGRMSQSQTMIKM